MMQYESFKKEVVSGIMKYIPDNKGYVLKVVAVNKVNVRLDGITLINIDAKSEARPTLYINDLYEIYQKGVDLDVLLCEAAMTLMERPEVPSLDESVVIMQAVNLEKNSELLKSIPHRIVCDLAIIYRLAKVTEDGVLSAIINYDVAESLKLDAQGLFDEAAHRQMGDGPFQCNFYTLYDAIVENAKVITQPSDAKALMYVIQTDAGCFGAGAIANTMYLLHVSKILGGDFFILPSSVDELIVVPSPEPERDPVKLLPLLETMVRDANRSDALREQDVLSDTVYFFDRETETVLVAKEFFKK